MCAWQPEVGEEWGVITCVVGGNKYAAHEVASNIHFPTFYAQFTSSTTDNTVVYYIRQCLSTVRVFCEEQCFCLLSSGKYGTVCAL